MPDRVRLHVEALIASYHAHQITARELGMQIRRVLATAGLELPAPQSTHDA